MPIDPTIISQLLGPKPGEFTTPAEDRKVVADARTAKLQAQNQELLVRDNTLKLRAQEDARREEALIRKVAMESGGDWEVIIPKLRQLAPGAAMKYEEQLAKIRKEGFEAQFKANENEKASIQKALGILRAIGDDATYQQMLPTLRGMNDDLGKMLPAQFDPQRIEQLQQYGITAEKALDLSRQSLQLIADGKLTDGVASALSMADTEQEWNETLHDLQQAGVPKAFLKVFGAWRPNAVQEVLTMAMTPEKRAELDQWTKTYNEGVRRFDKTFVEQQRHNQETEKNARGMLGVARTNAATSRMNAVTNQQTASGGGAEERGFDALVRQAIANPELLRPEGGFTATLRGAIATEMAARGVPVPIFTKLTTGQQDQLVAAQTVSTAVTDVLKAGDAANWEGMGTWDERGDALLRKVGKAPLNPKATELRSSIALATAVLREILSGKNVTDGERVVLTPLIPEPDDGPERLKIKLRKMHEWASSKGQNLLKTARGDYSAVEGRLMPSHGGTAPAPSRPVAPTGGKRHSDANPFGKK